ncbi:MAG: aminoacetone oxidase family FAD-binding enzyme, partial [Alistipes sp.]|nr:aminoacetone oxidase family FAD-binding enzyme [Candidatus Minthomonas equi]
MIRADILIVGGGAAGLMAACRMADAGCSTVLVEKGSVPGRKILITGKGRCNITNMAPWEEFKTHIHPDSGFLKSAFFAFSNEDVKDFFEQGGVPVKEERGKRLFPESDKSVTVRDFLWKTAMNAGVGVLTGYEVVNIQFTGKSFITDVQVDDGKFLSLEQFVSKALIITTGGKSYPYTGSTGSGYEFASSLGHTIVETFPSLTALRPSNYDMRLAGIHLKNVGLSLVIDGDCVDTREGELDFTNNGIEGSLGFQFSRKAIVAMKKGQRVALNLDLKPALDFETLAARVSRESYGKNIGMKKYLSGYLPLNLIEPFRYANPD